MKICSTSFRAALLFFGMALPILPDSILESPQRAWAQPAPIRQISVELLVVHATDSKPGIDPRLSRLASSFRYFKYQGYWLLSTQSAPIAIGASNTFTVEGGRKVKVTLVSADETRARVRVEMSNKDGKLLDTTVSINRNGTFIVAGPRYEDGILMLPLKANY
jgi:hypothetical protein